MFSQLKFKPFSNFNRIKRNQNRKIEWINDFLLLFSWLLIGMSKHSMALMWLLHSVAYPIWWLKSIIYYLLIWFIHSFLMTFHAIPYHLFLLFQTKSKFETGVDGIHLRNLILRQQQKKKEKNFEWIGEEKRDFFFFIFKWKLNAFQSMHSTIYLLYGPNKCHHLASVWIIMIAWQKFFYVFPQRQQQNQPSSRCVCIYVRVFGNLCILDNVSINNK